MAGNIAKRANGKWRARYRDEAGKEHSRHFDRKIDAQQWLDQVTSTLTTGPYADPQAGRGPGIFALRVSLIINKLPWTARFRGE